jgi:tetratricopeptide (TPR) repeat protein/predicted ArsR family transcriptional regulator
VAALFAGVMIVTDIETIAIYGPGNLKPQDLVNSFVARENTLAYFLAELRHQTEAGASPRHHLLIGQRGMGKTTLLHRIAIAVNDTPELAEHLVPLTFREEQYNVINLHVFWRNSIESLLDWLELRERNEEAKALEADLNRLEDAYEANRKAKANGENAFRAFWQACERIQRRPVLFLDNLDIILDALKKHDWGLRDILQRPGGPVVIGAAAAYPKSLSDRKAAFFDFFRITTLDRLEHAEVRSCLRRLALKRGEAGKPVLEIVTRNPGRIDAITELTGGNPRTLAVLYLLLESQAGGNAFADLEKLLDRMTPLYKARTEEAAPQARAVLDAVALHWYPITANEAARESGLDVTVINAQLTRLENDGYIEKVPVSGTGRSGYQIVERFFNIWYLMRHGNRRLRERIRFLTAMLQGFYSPGDRENLARDYLRTNRSQGRADMMLALSESVDDPIYRKALSHAGWREWINGSDAHERLARLVDLRDFDPDQADMLELEQQALAVERGWPEGMDSKQFWELLGGSLLLSAAQKRRIVASLAEGPTEPLAELVQALSQETVTLCEKLAVSKPELQAYQAGLRDGCIRHHFDLQGASAAALHENNPDIAAIACLLATCGGGDLDQARETSQRFAEENSALWQRVREVPKLQEIETTERVCDRGDWLAVMGFPEEAEAAYRKSISLNNSCARPWDAISKLRFDAGQYEEAANFCRKATEIDPKFVLAWYRLGNILGRHLACPKEAESAYRHAISLDPKNPVAWNNLGNVLSNLACPEEAETAYRQAIEIDSKNAMAWYNLGNLLAELARPEEAEAAFRQAIKLDPKDAATWGSLGNLLDDLSRHEEAEAAYRQAIALDPKDAVAWYNLGVLLAGPLARPEEAKAAYRQAIAIDPKHLTAWYNLGNLLDDLSQPEEAEAAYRQAMALDPKDAAAWYNLGALLTGPLSRPEEAETAFRQAIALDPNDAYAWNSLGNVLQDFSGQYQEAETTYLQCLELDSENEFAHANLAYLYWLHLNKPDEAQHHAELAKPGLAECGRSLLDAMQALVAENQTLALQAFNTAIGLMGEKDWANYGDDVQRILRYIAAQDQGPAFSSWMEQAAYPDRYAPLYWAFRALLEGEDILLNVSPEVRRTAERIYKGLAVGAKPPANPPKRGRRSKS